MKKALLLLAACSLACSAAFAADANVAVAKTPAPKAIKVETKTPAPKAVKAEEKAPVKKAVTHAKKAVVEATPVPKAPAAKAPVRVGMKAGLNLSTLSSNQAGVTFKFALNRDTGLFVEIPMGKTFVLQPEINYCGRTFGIDTGLSTAKSAVFVSGLVVPVLLKAKLGAPGASVHPTFFVGPQLGYILTAKMKDWNSTGGEYQNMLVSGSEMIKRTSFEAVVGTGYDFKKVTVDLRFALDLTNMSNDDTGTTSAKSRSFEVALGYLFN